jgi:signal transduction histidine kinase
MVYHELRNPLGLVATAARAVAEECTDDDVRRRCEVIERAAERMLRVAQQVLDIAQMSLPRPGVTYIPSALIAKTAGDLEQLGMPLVLEVAEDAKSVQANGCPEQLEALIQSLLMNARDHSMAGTTVEILVDATEMGLSVSVSNVIGSARQHQGLGLGTIICAELAGALGTTLTTSIDSGRYSVAFCLPAAAGRADRRWSQLTGALAS